jgi:hypothetical protein
MSQKNASVLFALSIGILAFSACKPRQYNSDVKESFMRGGENNPAVFEIYGKLEYNFEKLKTLPEGKLTNQPWSDTYWPNSEGGITARWRNSMSPSKTYKYKSPYSPEEIDKMAVENPALLNELSPAEKYDVVTGGYRNGWPLWQREAMLTTSLVSKGAVPERVMPAGAKSCDWEGKCHAWVPASLHFPEPGTVDVDATTASGQPFKVHFGSSDIKALLIAGYDMFLNQYPDYARAGSRCSRNYRNLGAGSSSPCLDTNAGTFFVLTTNMIQEGKTGFVIDRDPGTQVWNQPVWAYQHTFVGDTCPIEIKQPARKNQRVAHIKTSLAWVGELHAQEAPHGDKNRVEIDNYEYCVEIDEKDNVVGGAWVSTNRPDFIWMTSKPDFSKIITDSHTGMKFDFTKVISIFEKSRMK